MSRKSSLALPLLLLAATTIAVGGIVYGLLWKEANRLRKASLASAEAQALTVVENMGLTMGEIKTALSEALQTFEGPNFEPQLSAWQAEDPSVGFSFSWNEETPFVVASFPLGYLQKNGKGSPLRQGDGRWIWEAPLFEPKAEQLSVLSEFDAEQETSPAWSNFAGNDSLRKSIRNQSQEIARVAKSAYQPRQSWIAAPTEWIHSQVDGGYWVGLVRWNDGSRITGAGISLETLGPILKRSFPKDPVSTIAYLQILNDRQEVVASSQISRAYPSMSSYKNRDNAHSFPIGPDLPGWKLVMVSTVEGSLNNVITSPPGIATAAALALLMGTGLWLVYQSRSSQLDAFRKVSFVSNVSHELKTPLTTIRMFSELMQSGRVKDEEKRNNYLDTITRESQRLTRLVNNVLDFNRLDRGQRKLELEQQAISPPLENYLEIRRQDLAAAGMQLEVDLPSDTVDAYFDRDALCQILGNLIDNAIKYAADGELFSVTSDFTDNRVRLFIEDQGEGLPPKLRKRKFSAFQQGDESLTRETDGFGLGLSISQTLAEAMGGNLRYRHPQKPGERPRFTLVLPR